MENRRGKKAKKDSPLIESPEYAKENRTKYKKRRPREYRSRPYLEFAQSSS